jgi:hypothetical protein
MPNDEANVPSVFGGKVDVTDMKSLAQKAKVAADNNPRGGGAPDGSEYLNFSGKRGIFTIGQDKRRIEDDERWVVDVTSFQEGWVCWKGGRPEATRLSNIYTGVPVAQPDPEERGPFDSNRGEGWFQAKAMVMRSVDEDQQGYFKINSISGVGEMADLMEAFSERAGQGLPCWPVVCLEAEEFESQGYKNFKPMFNVQGWLSNDQLQELANGADIDDLLDSEEPKKASAKDEDVEEKPAARSRRRARK